jgi:hypothetical protein
MLGLFYLDIERVPTLSVLLNYEQWAYKSL